MDLEETARGYKRQKRLRKQKSQSLNELKEASPFKAIEDSENDGVESFGNFILYHYEGLYYPDTIIGYDKLLIASDEKGNIHIYSFEHNKSLTFQGRGGTYCV